MNFSAQLCFTNGGVSNVLPTDMSRMYVDLVSSQEGGRAHDLERQFYEVVLAPSERLVFIVDKEEGRLVATAQATLAMTLPRQVYINNVVANSEYWEAAARRLALLQLEEVALAAWKRDEEPIMFISPTVSHEEMFGLFSNLGYLPSSDYRHNLKFVWTKIV